MTYEQLLNELNELHDDQLHMEALAQIDDEFFPITNIGVQDGQDDLVDGTPFLEIE